MRASIVNEHYGCLNSSSLHISDLEQVAPGGYPTFNAFSEKKLEMPLMFQHRILFFSFLCVLTLAFLYAYSLQKTLKAIDPELRLVEPAFAWLFLVPLFKMASIWILIVSIAAGYRRMHKAGRLKRPTLAGAPFGLVFASVLCYGLFGPLDTWPLVLPITLFWVLHWISISRLPRLVVPKVVEICNSEFF